MKELEKRNQASFYLHKYNTRMGIGWRSAPTEIGNKRVEKSLERVVLGSFCVGLYGKWDRRSGKITV